MIRLVAGLVEDGEDLVADELCYLAVELVPDERREPPEVRDQHRVHLGGGALLRERREAHEVGEQHAHLPAPAQRLLEIEAAETLLVPLTRRRRRDRDEPEQHQRVPLPPAQMPARLERDDDDHERLGEEREAERDGECEPVAAAAVDAEVRRRRERVEDDADAGDGAERPADLARRDRAVQRWHVGDRNDCPRCEHADDDRLEESRVPHDPERRRQAILDRGGCSERAGEDEADRRREHEAGVLPGER